MIPDGPQTAVSGFPRPRQGHPIMTAEARGPAVETILEGRLDGRCPERRNGVFDRHVRLKGEIGCHLASAPRRPGANDFHNPFRELIDKALNFRREIGFVAHHAASIASSAPASTSPTKKYSVT